LEPHQLVQVAAVTVAITSLAHLALQTLAVVAEAADTMLAQPRLAAMAAAAS
jgi:hypothetical protein